MHPNFPPYSPPTLTAPIRSTCLRWSQPCGRRGDDRLIHPILDTPTGYTRGLPSRVSDWDSLAALPEAALVGAACGAFASTDTPTLAPLPSSNAFIAAYEEAAQRRFTKDELEVAWAASIFPAAHNSRAEILFGHPI